MPTVMTELKRKFPTSWSIARGYRLPSGVPGEPYYIEWDPGDGPFGERWRTFDDNGVFFDGIAYNAVSIAQYALHQHQQLCSGDDAARERFLSQARYLASAMSEDGTFVYRIPMPQYGVAGPWLSCLAQGEAASVFLRAGTLTGEEHYRDLALLALQPLRRDVNEGGCSIVRGDTVFFEEIAAAPCHILNGHLSAAFACWEFQIYGIADPELIALHERAIRTLLQWLPRYDDDGWSYYQLASRGGGERHYASIFYHQMHIAQLDIYSKMTGRSEFAEMSRAWLIGLQRRDVRVRVWRDSAQWLSQTIRRKVVRSGEEPWKSMVLRRA